MKTPDSLFARVVIFQKVKNHSSSLALSVTLILVDCIDCMGKNKIR